MNSRLLRSMFGLAVLGTTLALVGCSSADESDSGEGAAAASADASEGLRFAAGVYDDGKAQVVTFDGDVRGSYFTALGDPANGGSTCSFAFSGHIDEADNGAEAAVVNITAGGADTTTGRLRVVKKAATGNVAPKLVLEFDRGAPGGCSRSLGSATSIELDGAKDLPDAKSIAGFAPVLVEKTYFYDSPNGTKRAAYILAGDIVAIKNGTDGIVKDGFVQAEYTSPASGRSTSGWLKYIELSSPWLASE